MHLDRFGWPTAGHAAFYDAYQEFGDHRQLLKCPLFIFITCTMEYVALVRVAQMVVPRRPAVTRMRTFAQACQSLLGWKAALGADWSSVSKVAAAHLRRAANAASTLGMTNHPMSSPKASSSLAVLDETCRNWASQIKWTKGIEASMRSATP